MTEHDVPQVGDIWKELDPRVEYQRFVKVTRVGAASVFIHKVEPSPNGWVRPARSTEREAQLKRFHGRSGGYGLYERAAT